MGRWLFVPRTVLTEAQAAQRPGIVGIDPAVAEPGEVGVEITVTGTGFLLGATAAFSSTGITVNSVTWVSDTELTLNIDIAADAPATARSLTIANPNTLQFTMVAIFEVQEDAIDPLAIASITPDEAAEGSTGNTATVIGTGFVSGCEFGFVPGGDFEDVFTTFVSATELSVEFSIVDGTTPGARDVTVTNPDLSTDTLVGGFTVTAA